MALTLLTLLPKQVAKDPVVNRSRWFMTAGLTLIGLQFLILFIGDFRFTNVMMDVIINISFFIPCSAIMSLAVLNLQRQGKLNPIEELVWVPSWLLAITMLITAAMMQDQPFDNKSTSIIIAEIGASAIYGLMQLYYILLQLKELKRMREVLDNYYDSRREDLLTWMKMNVILLALMVIFVPIVIFTTRGVLMGFGALLFTGLFYQWFCFCRYVISGEVKTVSDAEEEAVEEKNEEQELNVKAKLSKETMQRVEKAVTVWINHNGHLRQGITSPDAAKKMKLPRYQLSSWIKESGYSSFSNWITTLRVNHAKQLLVAHRDWSNETIAEQCGMSLSHFQKVFHEQTGMTPAQYVYELTLHKEKTSPLNNLTT